MIEALEIVIAEKFEVERQALRQRLAHRRRDAQTARLGDLLEALRQHDAGTGNRIVGDDDLAERDADPQLGANIVVQRCIERGLSCLKRERRGDRVGGALELGQQRVAAQFTHLAAVG